MKLKLKQQQQQKHLETSVRFLSQAMLRLSEACLLVAEH